MNTVTGILSWILNMGPHSSIGSTRHIQLWGPQGKGGGHVWGSLWGPGGGASLRPPRGGLQLSSAGTVCSWVQRCLVVVVVGLLGGYYWWRTGRRRNVMDEESQDVKNYYRRRHAAAGNKATGTDVRSRGRWIRWAIGGRRRIIRIVVARSSVLYTARGVNLSQQLGQINK